MKLQEVELGGFKSFAKPTRLNFADGLTAVIGPNGSGKSNLAEAVRWVLGEQSLKALRGKDSQDVIFAGTSEARRAGRAYVRLRFDNEDGRFGLDEPEVEIGRSLTTGGISEYTLNSQPVRLLDLQQLLAEAGIGTRTYTVISQGTVDRYLTASPAERKELFDDACGIKPLQLKATQSGNKLARSLHLAQELSAIVAELLPRLRVLEREVHKRQERERLEGEYETKQARWLHQAWYERHQELANLRSRSEELAVDSERAGKKRERLENELLEGNEPLAMDIRQPGKANETTLLRKSLAVIEAVLSGKTISSAALEKLRNEIRARLMPGRDHLRQGPRTSKHELQQAREEELAAEREIGAVQAGLEQAAAAADSLRQEILRERGSDFFQKVQTTPPPMGGSDEREIRRLGDELARLGEADPFALKEYEETKDRYDQLGRQLQDIQATADRLETLLARLRKEMDARFQQKFRQIQGAFARFFQQLFDGGNATLLLTDEGLPAGQAGIEIAAAPPGKRPRHIHLLSGGEKALTSLALLLAILETQAPPFIVLDEVDAALDEANSQRFATMLETMAAKTQCIVITHNRETMSKADTLYGVTMQQEGISAVYSVRLRELA